MLWMESGEHHSRCVARPLINDRDGSSTVLERQKESEVPGPEVLNVRMLQKSHYPSGSQSFMLQATQ